MDHLGAKCSDFYKLQERACAEMVLEYDEENALEKFAEMQSQESNETDYLKHVVRLASTLCNI